jgi:hypothetical protein
LFTPEQRDRFERLVEGEKLPPDLAEAVSHHVFGNDHEVREWVMEIIEKLERHFRRH